MTMTALPLYLDAIDRSRQALVDLAALPPNWDTHGGAPIGTQELRVAEIMATVPPRIVPTSRGGIQLEWHTGDWDIEIELVADADGGVSLRWLTANAAVEPEEVERSSGSERDLARAAW